MRLTAITMIAGLGLAACAHNGDDAVLAAASDDAVNGEAAYLEHCAGCHETGMLGAPREGNPSDWEGRSKLWQGVRRKAPLCGAFLSGAGTRSRTRDLMITNQLLYQLSYAG